MEILQKISRKLETVSKDRKLIFCFKSDPYFKLDPAGKVKIPSGGCSPEHLWYILYILPLDTGLPPCASSPPMTGQIWQLSSGTSRDKGTCAGQGKKRTGIRLYHQVLSLHFCKTSQLIGHRWSYENSRENSLHAKLQISYHLLIYNFLLISQKQPLNKISKYIFCDSREKKKKKPCYPFTWSVLHQWAALREQQMWIGRQNQLKRKRKTKPKNLKSAIQMLLEIEIKGREE